MQRMRLLLKACCRRESDSLALTKHRHIQSIRQQHQAALQCRRLSEGVPAQWGAGPLLRAG